MDIVTLHPSDKGAVLELLKQTTKVLQREGIKQWDRFYPNRYVVKKDLISGSLYGIRDLDQIMAIVTINTEQSQPYASIRWRDEQGDPAILHRLVVHPEAQGKGLGKRLLRFAEHTARQRGHTSVRLDVYLGNPKAIALYLNHDYEQRGEIYYPFRKLPYICMEKVL